MSDKYYRWVNVDFSGIEPNLGLKENEKPISININGTESPEELASLLEKEIENHR